jgi:hypothetical protein
MDDAGPAIPDAVGLIQHKVSIPDLPELLVPRPRIERALSALIDSTRIARSTRPMRCP